MRKLIVLPMMAAAMLLAGCEVKVSGNADVTSGDDAASADTAPQAAAAPAAAGDWTKVKVTGLTCGDNCYVQIEPAAGGDPEEVMCTAEGCNAWFETQTLPDDVPAKTYEVQMGTAEQVDAEGTVQEANFPAITAIREAS
jgi:hypothetical protein